MTRVPIAKVRLTPSPGRGNPTGVPFGEAFLDWVSHQPRLAVLLVAAALAWMAVALVGAGLIALIT